MIGLSRIDDAIASTKEMVVAGALEPGDRLPWWPDLAERLDLSRNTLREAVRALSPHGHHAMGAPVATSL